MLDQPQPSATHVVAPIGVQLAPLLRWLGAIALLGVAADHLYEYAVDHYSAIPTIGTLFLLNGIGAIALAVLLVVPWRRLLPAQPALPIDAALAAAGCGLAATSLIGLFVSESTPLFGFMEVGYRTVVVLAIVAELATIIVLAPLLGVELARARSARSRPGATRS